MTYSESSPFFANVKRVAGRPKGDSNLFQTSTRFSGLPSPKRQNYPSGCNLSFRVVWPIHPVCFGRLDPSMTLGSRNQRCRSTGLKSASPSISTLRYYRKCSWLSSRLIYTCGRDSTLSERPDQIGVAKGSGLAHSPNQGKQPNPKRLTR